MPVVYKKTPLKLIRGVITFLRYGGNLIIDFNNINKSWFYYCFVNGFISTSSSISYSNVLKSSEKLKRPSSPP